MDDMINLATGESQAITAAKLGNVGDLKLLHERHANFDYQDPDGWTALMTACATHHVDCALYLISCNANLELAAKDGWTALMIAIDHNQEEIVKALLDAGVKTGRFNYSGACELCIAAKYPRLAELLLEHGANPNQPHPKLPLVKPLFLTLSHCKDVHPEFIKTLVKHGAEINAQTKEGQTPLMVSVMNAGITKVLLECGADPSLHDQDGETALDYAQKPGVDPRAYEILTVAMQKMDKDRNKKDSVVSTIAEKVGKRYDEICAYFRDNPFGSSSLDLTILSLLPPIDRCLIIERVMKFDNSDSLTCIDKLSMAYLKAGWRDLAFEFIKQCDKCGWFDNDKQSNRLLYPQWDYDFFADKLNGLVIGNVSVCYDDTLRKFPDYDSGSQFCRLIKQLSVEYKGCEVLKGDETPEALKKFHDERLAYIKSLPNKSKTIEVDSDKGKKSAKQEIDAGGGIPLNDAMQKIDKDIERKNGVAIDKKASSAETEKRDANDNESIFTSETKCTINIDDIKSLTIFCDKYGATLTIGDAQLIAWYKVDIKTGRRAKGDYAFDGYAYISGKDFLRLKPILLKRGWEFHSVKSGSPWFAEGEAAVCPKEVEVISQSVNDGQRINDDAPNDECIGAKEETIEPVASDRTQLPKDERLPIEPPKKHGCLYFLLCAISIVIIVGCAVWMRKDGFPKVFSDPFGLNQGKDAHIETLNQETEQKPRKQEEQVRNQAEYTRQQEERVKREGEEKRLLEQQQALQMQLKHKESAGQHKKLMMAASQAAEEAGAKVHAVGEWNKGIAAWKLGDEMFITEAYELARAHYSEAEKCFGTARLAAEKSIKDALKSKALQQKKKMMMVAEAAEKAGAKTYAADEWNKGMGAWKNGNQSFGIGDYDSAKSCYSVAQQCLEGATVTVEVVKVDVQNLIASLPSIETRAAQLIRDNDSWLKWSVDVAALVSTGNKLCEVYRKYEWLSSRGLLGDTLIGEKSKLEDLIIRCYELASNAGNGEASLQLCLLYGGAEDISGAYSYALIPYSGTVFKRDGVLSAKYLKRAVNQKDSKALLLRDLKKK